MKKFQAERKIAFTECTLCGAITFGYLSDGFGNYKGLCPFCNGILKRGTKTVKASDIIKKL